MPHRSRNSALPATHHTVIIGDVAEMWSKLAWDADACRDLQVAYPSERQPLAYAAINVCIAAWSLRNWTEKALIDRASAGGAAFDKEGHRRAMNMAVPEQAMCEAIADTAKHARHRDGEWPGGRVSIDWQDGDEDCPPGYMLHHSLEGGPSGSLGVNSFQALCENWWKFLANLGLVQGRMPLPEWHQNKLRRIFPPLDPESLPPGCEPLS